MLLLYEQQTLQGLNRYYAMSRAKGFSPNETGLDYVITSHLLYLFILIKGNTLSNRVSPVEVLTYRRYCRKSVSTTSIYRKIRKNNIAEGIRLN